eukprot:6317366-Amphidinium_carterae.1
MSQHVVSGSLFVVTFGGLRWNLTKTPTKKLGPWGRLLGRSPIELLLRLLVTCGHSTFMTSQYLDDVCAMHSKSSQTRPKRLQLLLFRQKSSWTSRFGFSVSKQLSYVKIQLQSHIKEFDQHHVYDYVTSEVASKLGVCMY